MKEMKRNRMRMLAGLLGLMLLISLCSGVTAHSVAGIPIGGTSDGGNSAPEGSEASTGSGGGTIGCGGIMGGTGGTRSAVSKVLFTDSDKLGSFMVSKALGVCDVMLAGYDANGILTDAKLLTNLDLSEADTLVTADFTLNETAESYQIMFWNMDSLAPAAPVCRGKVSTAEKEKPTIYLAGDSTVCNYNPETEYPRTGWGQVLGNYLKDGAAEIVNYAVAGRSTKTFASNGDMEKIENRIGAGDLLLIQFGHNDMKQNPTEQNDVRVPIDAYEQNLIAMVEAATDRGAYPVLVSSMVRRPKDNDTYRIAQLRSYAMRMREVAERYGVAYVDLNTYSTDLTNAMSWEWAADLYMLLEENDSRFFEDDAVYPNSKYRAGVSDEVHFNVYGANLWAKEVARGIKKSGLYIADAIDLDTYQNVNPGDRFRAMNLIQGAYSGTEDFEGASPKFTGNGAEGGAHEVADNPSPGGSNKSAKVGKIITDTAQTNSPAGSTNAYITPVTTTVSSPYALPVRYFAPLTTYTAEFDLYLESEPDERFQNTTEKPNNWNDAIKEQGNNVVHYGINLRQGTNTVVGGVVTSTGEKTAWYTDKTFRVGTRHNTGMSTPNYQLTNLAKGAWHRIKLEYIPDTVDYKNTKIKFYVDGDYKGENNRYFDGIAGADQGFTKAPTVGLTGIHITAMMRNILNMYIDNVTISAK